MRVWVDLTNSPHVLVMRPLIEAMRARGHDVALFTDLRQLYEQQELALYPDMRFALNFVAEVMPIET